MTRRRASILLGVALLSAWFWSLAGAANGQPADAVLMERDVKLVVTDDEPKLATAALTVLNVSTAAVRVTFVNPPGCEIQPKTFSVPEAEKSTIGLRLKGCDFEADAVQFDVKTPIRTWKITATVESHDSPDWRILAYPVIAAALASAVVVALVFARWEAGDTIRRRLTTPLPKLEDYDFNKSWASNATVIASAFAAIFGSSEVIKSLLGDEQPRITALVVVSTAVALGFTTAAALVVAATKVAKAVDSDKGAYVSVGGILAAAVFTLTGAATEVAVLTWVGAFELQFDWSLRLVVGGLGALAIAVLLFVYAPRSLSQTIRSGAEEELPDVVTFQLRELDAVAQDLHPAAQNIRRLVEGGMKPDETVMALYRPKLSTELQTQRRSRAAGAALL